MEQKDSHFNIHDYVDLSGITDQEKYRIVEDTLQAFANDPIIDGQTLLKEAYAKQGEKIAITTEDFQNSTLVKNRINLDFEEIKSSGYAVKETSATESQVEKTIVQSSLSEVLWHELEHARENNSIFKQANVVFAKLKLTDEFQDFLNESPLSDKVKNNLISPLPTHTFDNLLALRSKSRKEIAEIFDLPNNQQSQNNEESESINEILDFQFIILPQPVLDILEYAEKADVISDSFYEDPIIRATNENLRLPLGLPFRDSHEGYLPTNTAIIESLPEMKQRLFDERLPDLELTLNGECIVCEDVGSHEAHAPESTPTTEQTAPSKERE